VAAVAVLALALLFGGLRALLLVGGVLLAANLTTLLLSETVSVQRDGLPGSDLWPSNHTTAVAAAGLSLALVAPRRWRPLAAEVDGTLRKQ
jgi:membrane-associated phospholipid phosphatase